MPGKFILYVCVRVCVCNGIKIFVALYSNNELSGKITKPI